MSGEEGGASCSQAVEAFYARPSVVRLIASSSMRRVEQGEGVYKRARGTRGRRRQAKNDDRGRVRTNTDSCRSNGKHKTKKATSDTATKAERAKVRIVGTT